MIVTDEMVEAMLKPTSDYIDSEVAKAVAAEREACAKLAIELDRPGGEGPGHMSNGYEIAAAIRARGK